MRAKSKLYVFEGLDGSGKTSLSLAFTRLLNANGIECSHFSFPGCEPGTLGKYVYDFHHDPRKVGIESVKPTSLQLMHIAAHIDAIESGIIPALKRGRHVILDRFWWSTWAYGVICGVDKRALRLMIEIERFHWGEVRPASLFFLRRKASMGANPPGKWRSLEAEYRKLIAQERHKYRIQVIDNEQSIENTLSDIARLARITRSSHTRKQISRAATGHRGQLDFYAGQDNNTAPLIFKTLSPAKPTVVYDTYWRFAVERQAIFFDRLDGKWPPWTDDPIMRVYKFTNAYRASDRVSQYLISKVIYRGDQSPEEVFFRTLLFKVFNKIETWELIERELGAISVEGYSFKRFDDVLSKARLTGKTLYSAAYIMPSGGPQFGCEYKHRMHLKLIERMMQDELIIRLMEAASMGKAFELLRSYPTIGDFLAYQYVTDLNYSTMLNFRESEFVVPGPGAINGIRKCFSDLGGLNESEIIKFVTDRQQEEMRRLNLEFRSLWGRPLQLVDCQNLFCEVDKYSRLKHPEFSVVSGRTRIKQRFRMNPIPIKYWYPPKWGINEWIASGGVYVSSI